MFYKKYGKIFEIKKGTRAASPICKLQIGGGFFSLLQIKMPRRATLNVW